MTLAKKRHSAVRKKVGKPELTLTGTPKQLAVLDLLQDGPLPSTYIKTWLEPKYRHDGPRIHTYTDHLLTELDDGHYIGMPEDAKTERVLYRPFVYELRSRGALLLVERDLWRPSDGSSDQFKHRFMRSVIRFSFAMAPREIAGLRLITEADILANSKCPATTRTEKYPSHVPLGSYTLKPDGTLFGYEYTNSTGAKAFMFFHGFEADRGTEQQSKAAERKTIAAMIRNYTRYFNERVYATRYGLSQASIPIVTNKPRRMLNMMEFVRTECPPGIQSRFMFKTIPDFREGFPPPTAHMVTEPWARIGAESLHILETLKVTAERKSHDPRAETRPRGGTGSAEAQD